MRLAKFLAHGGVASRRKAEEVIAAGRVTVGGEVVRDPARDVDAGSDVRVDGERVGVEGREVWVVNKPVGVVSTAREPGRRPAVVDLVDSPARLYPVGRLDADSSGLLLLTNDGELANRIAHPSQGVDKEYLVEVEGGPVAAGGLRRIREGIDLDDGTTAPATASQPMPGVLSIAIHEGRNRQIRRMCEAIGHPVRRLVRTRIGPISDRTLAPGTWRELTADERRALTEAVAGVGRRYDRPT
jgi:23S rRNA pseudouridine2605 synthase